MGSKSIARFKSNISWWLSFSIHFLLFLVLLYYYFFPNSVVPEPKKEESYYYYVPAYAYTPAARPVAAQAATQEAKPIPSEVHSNYDLSLLKSRNSFKNIAKEADTTSELTKNSRLRPQQATEYKYLEPIHMVGEKLLDDPFRKLLGRAITGKLYYPEVARQLQMRGIVSIGFVLHTDGTITGARVIRTSRQKVLDAAALDAVQRASPIYNVDLYLKEAEYLVVNIIF